jgi:superfamily II DNA or RNA helicase
MNKKGLTEADIRTKFITPAIASGLQIPLLTGTTAQRKRDAVYADFKEGRVKVLAVSKIANFAVDLPDASVAIQISGTFGSRQCHHRSGTGPTTADKMRPGS